MKRITDEKQDTLDRAERLGLRPGAHVKVLEKAPHETYAKVKVDGTDRTLNLKMASAIMVEKSGEG